jgi:hypothetical protein
MARRQARAAQRSWPVPRARTLVWTPAIGGRDERYTERDAAKDTDVPEREINATRHHARDQSDVRDNCDGDLPTRKNREDGRDLTRRVIDRGRERGPDRPEGYRPER